MTIVELPCCFGEIFTETEDQEGCPLKHICKWAIDCEKESLDEERIVFEG